MEYVIIENFNDSISLIADVNGDVMTYTNLEEAKADAKLCQNGIVLPLEPKLMDIIQEASDFVGVALFELDELEKESGPDGDRDTLEDRLESLLY